MAEKNNVILAIEPLNRYELSYNNTVDEMLQIIKQVNSRYVRLLIDTFHMNIEERAICDSIVWAKDYISAVHLADSNRMAPGCGHLNFLDIIRALKMGF